MTLQQRMDRIEKSQSTFQKKVHKDIREIKTQMSLLNENSTRNRDDIKEMKDALLGNTEYGIPGKLVTLESNLGEQRAVFLKYKDKQMLIDSILEGSAAKSWIAKNFDKVVGILGVGLTADILLRLMPFIQAFLESVANR